MCFFCFTCPFFCRFFQFNQKFLTLAHFRENFLTFIKRYLLLASFRILNRYLCPFCYTCSFSWRFLHFHHFLWPFCSTYQFSSRIRHPTALELPKINIKYIILLRITVVQPRINGKITLLKKIFFTAWVTAMVPCFFHYCFNSQTRSRF